MPRSRIAAGVLAATLVLATGACGGDDDSGSDPTTTLADAPTTEVAAATTTADSEPAATTTPTTSPNLPPIDSPLEDQLLAPAAVGDGYGPDDTLGQGTFDGDLCEDVIIEPTWDDQAGQGLSQGEGDQKVTFTQAVLAFADEAAAEGFATAVADGQGTCLAVGEPTTVEVGDEAVLFAVSDEEGVAAAAIVRVGPRVTVLTAFGPSGEGILDEDLVQAAGAALGG